jgi:PilZ domain
MTEQRRRKREQSLYYLQVYPAGKEEPLGRLVDLTTDGLMLVCEVPVAVGSRYRLNILLPQDLAEAAAISCLAECRWCRSALNPDFHDAGFRITEVSDRDRSLIDLLITHFSFSG